MTMLETPTLPCAFHRCPRAASLVVLENAIALEQGGLPEARVEHLAIEGLLCSIHGRARRRRHYGDNRLIPIGDQAAIGLVEAARRVVGNRSRLMQEEQARERARHDVTFRDKVRRFWRETDRHYIVEYVEDPLLTRVVRGFEALPSDGRPSMGNDWRAELSENEPLFPVTVRVTRTGDMPPDLARAYGEALIKAAELAENENVVRRMKRGEGSA